MKNKLKKANANLIPIIQIILLSCVLVFPHLFNLSKLITDQYSGESVDIGQYHLYLLFMSGNSVIGLVFFFFVLCKIRKSNSEKIFNNKDFYHNYTYSWYWICGKILGFKKCNLVRVPVFMQFKLVTRQTFDDYLVGDNYATKNETIKITNCARNNATTINLILSDTYPIEQFQLPKGNDFEDKIWVCRENRNDSQRYYNSEFVRVILNSVRNLNKPVKRVNVFATTNPKHTLEVVESVFKLGGRGDVESLYVFQQKSTDNRMFETTGYKIY